MGWVEEMKIGKQGDGEHGGAATVRPIPASITGWRFSFHTHPTPVQSLDRGNSAILRLTIPLTADAVTSAFAGTAVFSATK